MYWIAFSYFRLITKFTTFLLAFYILQSYWLFFNVITTIVNFINADVFSCLSFILLLSSSGPVIGRTEGGCRFVGKR